MSNKFSHDEKLIIDKFVENFKENMTAETKEMLSLISKVSEKWKRLIKFRVWDPEKKVIINDKDTKFNHYGIDFSLDGDWRTGCVNIGGDYFDTIGESDGAVLMQFTGLLDKNKKEIYEGDILKVISYKLLSPSILSSMNFSVIFEDGAFKIKVGPSLFYPLNNEVIHKNEIEVIGNIYENPELLEECKNNGNLFFNTEDIKR
jgi:uncharacterized phage protein (TIGR01671 family)